MVAAPARTAPRLGLSPLSSREIDFMASPIFS
jgi:hypothetical protein